MAQNSRSFSLLVKAKEKPMSQVTLNWNPNTELNVSYDVFRGASSNNEGPLPLNPSPLVFASGIEPNFTDSTVLPGSRYFYRVAAFVGGLESPFSNEVETVFVPFPQGAAKLSLGRASGFGVLAATTLTNTGASEVRGDIGVAPGTSIFGFDTLGGPGFFTGSEHIDDFVAIAAQADALAAFNAGLLAKNGDGSAPTNLGTAVDIGGRTLPPGVYSAPDSLGITGNVILDANGNADAVWIFQVGTAITMAGTIVLRGGAQAANVYWLAGSAATIGTGSIFSGILIAKTSITLVTGANIDGQLLALTGAVTMQANNVAMFIPITLVIYAHGKFFGLGDVFFDCASGTYQEVIVPGITSLAGTTIVFNPIIGGTTQDGSVIFQTLDPPIGSPLQLPPSQPVAAPTQPAAPTGLFIKSES
jgi:hypothetical protein